MPGKACFRFSSFASVSTASLIRKPSEPTAAHLRSMSDGWLDQLATQVRQPQLGWPPTEHVHLHPLPVAEQLPREHVTWQSRYAAVRWAARSFAGTAKTARTRAVTIAIPTFRLYMSDLLTMGYIRTSGATKWRSKARSLFIATNQLHAPRAESHNYVPRRGRDRRPSRRESLYHEPVLDPDGALGLSLTERRRP